MDVIPVDRPRDGGTAGGERRLAAILSADAKGYSRLMGEDEVGTVQILTAYRSLMAETIVRFRGRVVDSPGDNVLAEFGSVVDAVLSAVEIQEALRERNAQLASSRRLEFRIGVNLGDVLVEGGRVYGDAVNIAARIESLADAGGVCISGTVYDQVATKVPLVWEFLGEQSVKNIARRVRVYRVRLGATANRSASRPSVSPADRPSIAVLPFREPDVSEGHSYFGDGIVEDIIGALASLPDLVVISRNSTSRFRGTPVDVGSVGRDLGVRYVLSGSVRRSGSGSASCRSSRTPRRRGCCGPTRSTGARTISSTFRTALREDDHHHSPMCRRREIRRVLLRGPRVSTRTTSCSVGSTPISLEADQFESARGNVREVYGARSRLCRAVCAHCALARHPDRAGFGRRTGATTTRRSTSSPKRLWSETRMTRGRCPSAVT